MEYKMMVLLFLLIILNQITDKPVLVKTVTTVVVVVVIIIIVVVAVVAVVAVVIVRRVLNYHNQLE